MPYGRIVRRQQVNRIHLLVLMDLFLHLQVNFIRTGTGENSPTGEFCAQWPDQRQRVLRHQRKVATDRIFKEKRGATVFGGYHPENAALDGSGEMKEIRVFFTRYSSATRGRRNLRPQARRSCGKRKVAELRRHILQPVPGNIPVTVCTTDRAAGQ